MPARIQPHPQWLNLEELSFNGQGSSSPPPASLRLSLRALIFTDQLGNVVIVDPHKDKPLGAHTKDRRQPSLYLQGTESEVLAALEEMIWVSERWLKFGRREVAALERARDAKRRIEGLTPPRRLPKVA